MKTAKLTLHPGDRGTTKEMRQYGDKLVCVRYRYDETLQKRFKTVELKDPAASCGESIRCGIENRRSSLEARAKQR